jgi:hypothetical protein
MSEIRPPTAEDMAKMGARVEALEEWAGTMRLRMFRDAPMTVLETEDEARARGRAKVPVTVEVEITDEASARLRELTPSGWGPKALMYHLLMRWAYGGAGVRRAMLGEE